MSKRGLTREEVLAAAVKIVDDEGLEALSMRRLGQALGVEAMSLYRHVANKEDLLNGIHGALLATVKRPARRGTWQTRTSALAHALRDMLRAHPRALVLFGTRAAVSPSSILLFEEALEIVAETGLSVDERLHVVHGLLAYVVGSALWHFTPGDASEGVAYAALPSAQFPRLREVAPRLAHWDVEAEFELGLDAFLTGVAARVRRR